MDGSQEGPPIEKNAADEALKTSTRVLGVILPFVILFLIPATFFSWLYLFPHGYDDLNLKTRQEALENNWERYLSRNPDGAHQRTLEGFDLTLCPFNQEGSWDLIDTPEEAGFICGDVTVPLFHDQPDGKTIQIPIAIWPDYENPPQGSPLFITHGGPGGSALESYPSYLYERDLAEKRDIFYIDQRGTQYADPVLDCPQVTDSSYDGLESYLDYLGYCRARLTGKGVNLAAFNTGETARDFEVVRQIFDFEQIIFYGVSYGTHVGQYLAAFHPDQLESMILDGVAPLPLDYLNRSVTTHARILDSLIGNCKEDPDCSSQYPRLEERFWAVIERLDQQPQVVKFQDPSSFLPMFDILNGEIFYNYLLTSSYLDNSYASLPYIIQQAENNRFDSLVSFMEKYFFNDSTASGVFYSVICSEHTPFGDLHEDGRIISSTVKNWEVANLAEASDLCARWNVDRSSSILDEMPRSPVPTLLLSGHFDPVTPPYYAELAGQSFEFKQDIIDPIGSHGVAFTDDCSIDVVNQFLAQPYRWVDSDCLWDPERRSAPVETSALSVPSLGRVQDLAASYLVIPGLILMPIMLLRYLGRGIRKVWKRHRGVLLQRTIREWVLHNRFEFFNWVFLLICIGYGAGLDHYLTRLNDFPGYWNASALPGEARLVMLIPLLIIAALPFVVVPSIRLWKYNPSVLSRTYYLFQALVCTGLAGYLVFSNMLFLWLR